MERLVSHPINAFLLVKHLSADWENLRRFLMYDLGAGRQLYLRSGSKKNNRVLDRKSHNILVLLPYITTASRWTTQRLLYKLNCCFSFIQLQKCNDQVFHLFLVLQSVKIGVDWAFLNIILHKPLKKLLGETMI